MKSKNSFKKRKKERNRNIDVKFRKKNYRPQAGIAPAIFPVAV